MDHQLIPSTFHHSLYNSIALIRIHIIHMWVLELAYDFVEVVNQMISVLIFIPLAKAVLSLSLYQLV